MLQVFPLLLSMRTVTGLSQHVLFYVYTLFKNTKVCFSGNCTHINELFDFWFPQITADLCSKQHACGRHQLPVLLVETTLQHQLLKVNKSHRYGDWLETALLAHSPHLPLQTSREEKKSHLLMPFLRKSRCMTWHKEVFILQKNLRSLFLEGIKYIFVPSDLAQCQLDVRKLLLEGLIHVLLQVRWFYILDYSRLQTNQHTEEPHVSMNYTSIKLNSFACQQSQ